eukprot:TRINITY_DN1459_c0_g1_i3.p1 TRINITY_DN1459_c0_g1~~TRINITY_DN1459_c0_g1_i3.p1  ORF type:complete len:256 (+),score=46.95 TRINITY_DN1459_c0_g1_i3:133-900(+)
MAEDTLRTSCEIDGLAQAADPSLRLSTEEIHFLQDLEVQEQEEVAREAGKSEEDIAREAAEADRAHIAEPEVQLSEVGEIKVDMTRFMGPPSEVLPHLFLGSAWNARVAATLQHNGITHVLNVASNCPQMNHPGLNVVHMPISYSYKGANSFDKFEEMFNFIGATVTFSWITFACFNMWSHVVASRLVLHIFSSPLFSPFLHASLLLHTCPHKNVASHTKPGANCLLVLIVFSRLLAVTPLTLKTSRRRCQGVGR